VRLAALESDLGHSALQLEAPEQALVGAATAGGMLPRLADFEAAWLQEASAGAVRVRFTALGSELGMPSSGSDAALAPPTPPPARAAIGHRFSERCVVVSGEPS
jgi:hypothetical protein